jgi:uncharacterized protein
VPVETALVLFDGMLKHNMVPPFKLEQIVIQPTTLCNLNCQYCYLPARNKSRRMSIAVAERLADALAEFQGQILVTWHGGEPLATGYEHFCDLLKPFFPLVKSGRVVHAVQTNATLINERWAELFRKHQFRVGISVDGPASLNVKRVNWHGLESFKRVKEGVAFLRKFQIEFSAIAVIGRESLPRAREIYHFFCELGCSSLGVNLEERVGVHRRTVSDDSAVLGFWTDLFEAWKTEPVIRVREIRHVLSWMNAISSGKISKSTIIEIFPCIGFNGDVVLLSPEFLGATSKTYQNFIIGNVLKNRLAELIEFGQTSSYVIDYVSGVNRCRRECPYFSACGGLSAGNKFYETGSTNATETLFCQNSVQRPIDALLNLI